MKKIKVNYIPTEETVEVKVRQAHDIEVIVPKPVDKVSYWYDNDILKTEDLASLADMLDAVSEDRYQQEYYED